MGQNKNKNRANIPKATPRTEDNFFRVNSLRDRRQVALTIHCEAGLYGRNAVMKSVLRKQNDIKSLQYAKVLKDCAIEQFNKYLLTDEKKFENFGSNRRVRGRFGEKVTIPCITPTVRLRGGSIMWVRGKGFWQLQERGFARYKRQIESDRGSQHTAASLGTQFEVQGFLLMLDNDLNHTSKLSQRYLKGKD